MDQQSTYLKWVCVLRWALAELRLSAPAGLLVALAASSAHAATIQVTTTEQKISGTGGCSLQEAIWAANLGDSKAVQVDADDNVTHIDTNCELESDGQARYTIVLPAGEVFPMSEIVDDPFNYMGPTATPIILADIVIEANGSRLEHVPNGINFRAFAVGVYSFASGVPIAQGAGSLTLRNAYLRGFTVKGGDGREGGGGGLGAGGAIYVHGGGLTVEHSTFEANGAAGGNGSRNHVWAGGGGGGLSGHGGSAYQGGGGGGGGARGDGGGGYSACGEPCLGLGAEGGGGGGTVTSGMDGGAVGVVSGGFRCGGYGGYTTLNPFDSPHDGGDGECAGGGGGGGRDSYVALLESFGGHGGDGEYGGGGGGGSYRMTYGDAGDGGFGGGGGAAHPLDTNLSGFGPDGGSGGFGGGGGAAHGGYQPVGGGGPGRGGSFAGNASARDGGGGAGLGGAIFSHWGDVRIYNSTFTGNFAARGVAGGWPNNDPDAHSGQDQGAAIFAVGGSLTVLNSTVSGNEGTSSINGGAGIVVYAPGWDRFSPDPDDRATSFVLRNSIIAGNAAGSMVVKECRLINSADNSVNFLGSGNIITANDNCTQGLFSSADPMLGALALNPPGLTPTMALGAGSPAIDAADAATALDKDQRGVARPVGQGFDIGAYEWGAVAAKCKNVTVSAGASCQAQASIDDGSSAPDGGNFTLAQDPPGPYGLGITAVTLTATHESGASDSCQATVTVVDDSAPVVTPTIGVPVLSPTRQHNLVNVGLDATATDECSAPPTSFQVDVYGDEDDETPTDAETVFSPDASDVGVGTLRLRAERVDSADGRVYLVVVSGADTAGNTGYGCTTVVVPHNSSPASGQQVADQAQAAEAHCKANDGMPPPDYFVVGDGPAIGPKPKK
jgi:hypothetical protein